MVRLDLAGMNSREVNHKLKALLKTETEIEIDNPIPSIILPPLSLGKEKLPCTAVPDFTPGDFWKGPPSLSKVIPAGIPAII